MPDTNPDDSPSSLPMRLYTGRFFWLLLATVALILISGEIPDTASGAAVSVIPFVVLLVCATIAARGSRRSVATSITINAIFLLSWLSYFFHPHAITLLLTTLSLLACLFFALLTTFQFILRAGAVTADHIMAAICSYALIAMLFATVYTAQWYGSPTCFKGLDAHSDRPWSEFFYFSFTTLSTVGYGDIVPATSRTRSVVIIEEMTGTFYVAILIARLATLYPPAKQKEEAPPK